MSRRVLVADDDRHMVRTLCDILRLHGWEAVGVRSGEEAVAAVRDQSFSLVLMDVRMGGLNGVDALKAMKAIRPGIRVTLMTAYSASDLLAEAEREGAVRVLPKPVALPMLLETLAAAASDPRRVLVVDDEPAFLHSLADVLRQHDYLVLEATTLDEAIEQLEHTAPSPGAVVLDLLLDGVVDDESVLAIKRVSPAVAVILYSGHGEALDSVHRRLRGIRGTLRKPFPPERLLELLDDVFD